MTAIVKENVAPLKHCGCKGIRRCLICETPSNDSVENPSSELCVRAKGTSYVFCPECAFAFLASVEDFQVSGCQWHETLGQGNRISFPGVDILLNFVTETTATNLVSEINARPWRDSQSGRRKQDYGPKINFRKQRLKLDSFQGFPPYTRVVMNSFAATPLLADFRPVELCNLDYDPARGSSIDPHFDDRWVWGERLVTLSLLSLTFLTMSEPEADGRDRVLVHLPMPARSLILLRGPARYVWHHEIRRGDTKERRIAMTFRELSDVFLPGGEQEKVGAALREKAVCNDSLELDVAYSSSL